MFELRIMHRGLNGQTFAIVFTTIRGAPKLRNSAHRELSHPTLIPVVHAYICIYSLFTTKKPTAAQLSVGSSAPNRVRDHVLGHVKNMWCAKGLSYSHRRRRQRTDARDVRGSRAENTTYLPLRIAWTSTNEWVQFEKPSAIVLWTWPLSLYNEGMASPAFTSTLRVEDVIFEYDFSVSYTTLWPNESLPLLYGWKTPFPNTIFWPHLLRNCLVFTRRAWNTRYENSEKEFSMLSTIA